MILSTSTRLIRIVERAGIVSRMRRLARDVSAFLEEERAMLRPTRQTHGRSRLLQRALAFSICVGVFVASSVAIGGVGFSQRGGL